MRLSWASHSKRERVRKDHLSTHREGLESREGQHSARNKQRPGPHRKGGEQSWLCERLGAVRAEAQEEGDSRGGQDGTENQAPKVNGNRVGPCPQPQVHWPSVIISQK